MSADVEQAAKRLYMRNVADYADRITAETAWDNDPLVREFWRDQARTVLG